MWLRLSVKKNGQTGVEASLSIQVTRPGFEPRQAEPESAVLPLYYRAILQAQMYMQLMFFQKLFTINSAQYYPQLFIH